MENNPKVSVVISTYNQAEYLGLAIESILEQTYTNFEIVIVDDGSTDHTKQKVGQYQARYGDKIRYFFQKNQGPTAAEHFGIEQAKGEYIASLDHDDLWTPQFLEKQMKLIDGDEECSFVCSAAYVIDGEGNITGTYESGKYLSADFNGLLRDNFVIHASVILRKNMYFEVGGFDPDIIVTHDVDLWFRLAKKYRFKYNPEKLVKYRVHGANITKKLDKWLEDRLKSYKKKSIVGDIGFLNRHKAISRIYYKFGGFYAKNKEYYTSSICYLKAVLHDPVIGFEYWPPFTQKIKFSFFLRFLHVYYLIVDNWARALKRSLLSVKQ